jgi:hypothetical protein
MASKSFPKIARPSWWGKNENKNNRCTGKE